MIKNGWTDDTESTERTIEAMDYNIALKQKFIDDLIAENVRLDEDLKRIREEITTLEYFTAKGGNG
uniref:Uncharacterized protein n=1 Tax=viral metagenome TaxID=1070528 RepID=A0A6H1Z6Z1_9ZZZZ